MQFNVLQENLAEALRIVGRAVPTRPSIQILSHVLLVAADGRLTLSATTLETFIQVRIGANVRADGAIALPAKTLTELVNTLPPDVVELALDERTMAARLKCGGSTSTLKGLDAAEYPPMPSVESETAISLLGSVFRRMVGEVAFAAAKEDNRPILQGIHVEVSGRTVRMSGADGYRLGLVTTEIDEALDEDLNIIVPVGALVEASRICRPDEVVRMQVVGGKVYFIFEAVTLAAQLIDGQFPNVGQIVPKTSTTDVQVHRGSLLAAMKRAEIFARDSSNTMRLRMGESRFHVESVSQERGDYAEALDVSVEGPGVETAFNVKYLLDALAVLDDEAVVLRFTVPSAPMLMEAVGREGFRHVIMPMSVQGK